MKGNQSSAKICETMALSSCRQRAERTRPAFEKLLIGPIMVFGEMITGGHYLEVLRLGKQMAVGKHTSPSYLELHRAFVAESGFFGAFYRGFLPWGLIQCGKGVPVLFVQHESNYQLNKHGWLNPYASEKVSGFLGGTAQAILVCPFQKIKVNVVASENLNRMKPWEAVRNLVTNQGILSLFDGLLPMIVRRSLEWGIRFGVSTELKNRILEVKRSHGASSTDLTFVELIGCGLVGGACSGLTHPIDNIITNSQKPMEPGARRDVVSVIRRMMRESGVRAFVRGWVIKIVDDAYHMAWMYGVGTVVYDFVERELRKPLHF